MSEKVFNVLFLCSGNSARSIFGECLVNRWGRGRFRGFSAGSHPKGEVHPMTLELLDRLNFPTDGLRSKDWNEFAKADAPHMDFVFTVCDKAAAEICPVWPGQPMTAHWGVADPMLAAGDEAMRMLAFRRAFSELENRIKIFTSLAIESLDKLKMKEELEKIGQITLDQPLPDIA
jgi:protein-tyrosine-phosphatase